MRTRMMERNVRQHSQNPMEDSKINMYICYQKLLKSIKKPILYISIVLHIIITYPRCYTYYSVYLYLIFIWLIWHSCVSIITKLHDCDVLYNISMYMYQSLLCDHMKAICGYARLKITKNLNNSNYNRFSYLTNRNNDLENIYYKIY